MGNKTQKKQLKNSNTRASTIEIKKVNEDDRTIELSFSSEKPVQRWFGQEILSHDAGSMKLDRLNDIGVLLFNHDRSVVIGKVESAWLDELEKKGRAIVKFDDDEESEKIYQKVKNETLRGVSVGYSVDSWEEVKPGKISSNGRFQGPAEIALAWTPNEISIVSVPADENVGVGRGLEGYDDENEDEKRQVEDNEAQRQQEQQQENNNDGEGERDMGAKANKIIEPNDNKRQIIELERQRTSEIMALCRDFNVESDTYINEGRSIEEVRSLILDNLRSNSKPLSNSIEVTKD
ncbi:MAG: HK97 family phage prohead protease, partial [Peptostreptococcaceae bacterium]